MAVIILLPVVLIFFQSSLEISANDLILMLAYSLSFHVFGIQLWFTALKEAKPWVVASMLSLTPIVGSTLAFLWLGQFLLPLQLIGGAIIIITTFFISRENIKD
jgi:probable blue pigment (indigoidine) exporter